MNKILPALDINHGDKIDYLVSMSSLGGMLNDYAALYYKDKNHPLTKQKIALGNYNASLIRTANGKMITLIHDTSTPRIIAYRLPKDYILVIQHPKRYILRV